MAVLAILFVSCTSSNADKASSTADDSTVVAMSDSAQADDAVEARMPAVRYTVEKWKAGKRLVAWVDGKPVDTGVGLDESIYSITLMDQHDYNNDGCTDALLWDYSGGNRVCQPFFVTYNPRTARCEIKNDDNNGNGFEGSIWNPTGIVEQQPDGQWHLLLKVGDMRTDTYLIRPTFTVKKIKESTTAGKKLASFSRKQLFGIDEESEGKPVYCDVNGDGVDDEIIFGHDGSHASNWGKDMYVIAIAGYPMGDGEDTFCQRGQTFSLLQNKTNGMCDLLIDNSILYKFNGKMYVLVE